MRQLDTNCYKRIVDKIKEAENCRVLWLNVLETALRDFLRKPENPPLKRWLESADFLEVCTFAGVQPDRAKKTFQKCKKNIDKKNRLPYNNRPRYSRN